MRRTTPFLRCTVLLLGCAVAAGCVRNPVTGERELTLVSEDQEIAIGRQAYEQTARAIGLVEDQRLQEYVQRLGADLAADSERPELPWTFRVLDDPTPNAFAFPGGYIFVTRGILSLMDSEAELAAVLGHEIGHVTARHSVQQISRAQLAQLGLGLGMILFPNIQPLGGLFSSGLELMFLKYGRDAERQADELGFRYALHEGYDVREMDDVFLSLQRIGDKQGRSPLPSWLATHPDPGERIEAVGARLESVPNVAELRLGRPAFMGRIEGMVYGENPRQGFFRDGVFYHPELQFRLSFPQGWPTQNLPQAVVAQSPERDAALQLTLAEAGATEAARQFLAQQGIQGGQVSRETINGLPAVVASFQARTQQGVLQGFVAFIEYRGLTYQVLSFAPAERFASYDRLFRQVLGSFAPLTDPAMLAVQPNRLDVVEIGQAMTLAAFVRRYPTEIPLDEMVLINQVPDANTLLPAGTFVKRVVAG